MSFKASHEFIIGDIAPNYVFGCTWCLYSLSEYERKKEILKEVKQELGENSVVITRVSNGVIVFVSHATYKKVMNSLKGIVKNIDVEEDQQLYMSNLDRTVSDCNKFLKKVASGGGNFSGIVGLYCINKVAKVKEKVKDHVIEYNSFRLSLEQFKALAQKNGLRVNCNVKDLLISNGATAVLVPTILTR